MSMEDAGSVIIYGATGGIGSALARRLKNAGRKIFLAGRDQQRLARLADELDAPWTTIKAESFESFSAAMEKANENFSNINGIANCIGSVLLKPAHLTSLDEFMETLQVNLVSSFAIVQAGIKAMKANGGAFVFFSTAAARLGMPNHEAIAAAKSGVEGLALSAASSYASRGIRANVIAPGLVETEMTKSIWSNEVNAKASRAMHAVGRFGKPEELAAVAEFLLSPENSWITGQVIGADGGLGSLMTRRKG